MLTRQKVILGLLQYAGRPLTRTVFVKLAFLIRQETALRDAPTYYDFVPYRFGPFSFALYREMLALDRDGYVAWSGEDDVCLLPEADAATQAAVQSLSHEARSAIRATVSKYAGRSQRSLLKELYSRYPWYASRSELRLLAAAGTPEPAGPRKAVFSAGYQGLSVDAFFNRLMAYGIKTVLDVRANPISRKYGFAKSSLSEISGKLGMAYLHFPQVGIRSERRADLTDFESYRLLLDTYEQETLPECRADVRRLGEIMSDSPSVLVCMERDARWCHRSRLAKAIAAQTGLKTIHL